MLSVRRDPWLLPDGIDELLPPQARQLEEMRRGILDQMSRWGYELIMPPLVEYLESLLTGVADELEARTFTLLDGTSGRQLGIRADVTSQAARIDVHSLASEGVTRLCYSEQVAHARAARLLASRLPIRVGAELFGHAGVASDIEVISLLASCLQLVRQARVTIEIGDVSLFSALMRRAGLGRDLQQLLFRAVQRKAFHEVEALARDTISDRVLARQIATLPRLVGTLDVLDEAARVYAGIDEIERSLGALQEIAKSVQATATDVDLLFDLSELRGFDYHTGVVFAAYVDGCEYSLARGGRYDAVGARFGRSRHATGFDLDLKELATCQGPTVEEDAIWVEHELVKDPVLQQEVKCLRAEGRIVIIGLDGEQMPKDRCSQVLRRTGSGLVLERL